MTKVQCFYDKKFGHITYNCNEKFCNYYKQCGHIILDFPTRPRNKSTEAFHATTTSSPSSPRISSVEALTHPQERPTNGIVCFIYLLDIHGKPKDISQPWFVDFLAFNHMIGSPEHLQDFHSYTGTQNI